MNFLSDLFYCNFPPTLKFGIKYFAIWYIFKTKYTFIMSMSRIIQIRYLNKTFFLYFYFKQNSLLVRVEPRLYTFPVSTTARIPQIFKQKANKIIEESSLLLLDKPVYHYFVEYYNSNKNWRMTWSVDTNENDLFQIKKMFLFSVRKRDNTIDFDCDFVVIGVHFFRLDSFSRSSGDLKKNKTKWYFENLFIYRDHWRWVSSSSSLSLEERSETDFFIYKKRNLFNLMEVLVSPCSFFRFSTKTWSDLLCCGSFCLDAFICWWWLADER